MSVAIPFVNNVCHISEEHISDLLQGKNVYQFSFFEKFIDFFRNIFTGVSTISEYYQIYHLLYQHQNNHVISPPMSINIRPRYNDVTNWRPIIGFVKLIDNSKPETISQYSIEVRSQDDGISIINMKFDGIILAKANCSAENLEFLKNTLFNVNNGEIRSDTVGEGKEEARFYSIFHFRLEEHLSTHEKDLTDYNTLTRKLSANRDDSGSYPTADIDLFIKNMIAKGNITKESLAKHTFIGNGSYGSVYLFEETYAVKFSVNNKGNMIDTNSAEHGNAHPKRVSHYLNLANNDPDFSRHMHITFDNKKIDVLVSKYINGENFNIEDADNYERAESLLEKRGVLMHDLNVYGNILIKDDELFFVDGDQIVLSHEKRRERRVSEATKTLENQIRTRYEVNLRAAQREKKQQDITYYSSLLEEHNDLMKITVESQHRDNSGGVIEFVSRNSFTMAERKDSFLSNQLKG